MLPVEVMFFMQIVLGIFLFIILHKINQMKKQIDDITKEVKNYVAIVTSEEDEDEEHAGSTEEQNRLIQAVLSEYFP